MPETSLLEKIKTVVKYVFFPITILFGTIYYLIQDRNKYKAISEQQEAEKELAVTLTKKEEQEKRDKDIKEAWDAIRNRYIHGGPDQE